MSGEARTGGGTGALLAVLALVAIASLVPRLAFHTKIERPDGAGWIASDPDSLYHMRRLQRVFDEGLPVAPSDPYMNYPEGSAIPWPPAYTLLLAALLGPFAPDDPAQLKAFIEETTASLPALWGTLTSLLAALVGWWIAGRAGALVAGLHHALSFGSIDYSHVGNGDHHAFVSLLAAAMLAGLTLALRRDALDTPRRGALWGAGLGLLAGTLVATWVASLLYVIAVDLALAWLLFVNTRRAVPGLAAFGLTYHGAALALVVPAVLASPWTETQPWGLINLTWLHAGALALGGIVFVPLALLRAGSFGVRHYPWLVAATLAVAGAVLASLDGGPVAGIREAAAVIGRAEGFTTNILESRPLIGPDASARDHFRALGFGSPLVPLAWIALLLVALRRGDRVLVPWAVAVPLLGMLALGQWRFADGFAMPMAVALGWGAAALLNREGEGGMARFAAALRGQPRWALAAMGVGAVALVQGQCAFGLVGKWLGDEGGRTPSEERQLASRRVCDWLRENTPSPPDYSVLSTWGRGHLIEWAAERPTVATNFGIFVGLESYRTPSRVLLATDDGEAEALMEERRARYVFVSSQLLSKIPSLEKALGPDAAGRFVLRTPNGGAALQPAVNDTVAARLIYGIAPFPTPDRRPLPPVPWLRMVHASPVIVAGAPFGWVFERVAGARVEAAAAPGATLEVSVTLRFPGSPRPLSYRAAATAGDDGRVAVRIPYCTEGANGDGRATGPAEWSLGERSGTLSITDDDVRAGRVLTLDVDAG